MVEEVGARLPTLLLCDLTGELWCLEPSATVRLEPVYNMVQRGSRCHDTRSVALRASYGVGLVADVESGGVVAAARSRRVSE